MNCEGEMIHGNGRLATAAASSVWHHTAGRGLANSVQKEYTHRHRLVYHFDGVFFPISYLPLFQIREFYHAIPC